MREWMQQDLTVPKKVHEGFEKGLQQVYQMDLEPGEAGRFEEMQSEERQDGQKKYRRFWRRAGLVAAAAAAVVIVIFHEPIYNYAKSLFIHDTVMVEGVKQQEEDVRCIKIKDGVLTDDWEENYFDSMEDLGEQLGISFLKSTAENTVTGKGRVMVRMTEDGDVTVRDSHFSVKDISDIHYDTEKGNTCKITSDNAYIIDCDATFYTKQFQEDYGIDYEDSYVVEEYKTKNGLQAAIIGHKKAEGRYSASVYCDNIRYEYNYEPEYYKEEARNNRDQMLAEFKAFLDTLMK